MSNIDECRKRLAEKYKADEKGVWKIEGESVNPGYSGCYHQKSMTTYVEGTYKNVMEYALGFPKFFVWGAGGDITKIEIGKLP
jgi:hypothetical protein